MRPKVAIIADWLTPARGGAERVVVAMARAFPRAPIFTTVFHPPSYPEIDPSRVRTSWLQKLPTPLRKRHRALLALLPRAIESLDLREFDILLSSASFVGKGGIKRADARHICYLHTPPRFLWGHCHAYLQRSVPFSWLRAALSPLLRRLRTWDFFAARRPDMLIANSQNTAINTQKAYRLRPTCILPPPVDTKRFEKAAKNTKKGQHFVYLGRLAAQKNVEMIIQTFLQMPEHDVHIVGDGPERQKLEKMANNANNIHFLGHLPEEQAAQQLASACALIQPQAEDAGITAVEALAAGTPVVCLGQGGIPEVISHQQHGLHFADATVPALQQAIIRFIQMEKNGAFSAAALRARAAEFSEERFMVRLQEMVLGNFSFVGS